ncbi:hypothetical protein TYRP_020971 [Tyrophagus putrescentiae]|nr:hypothetical protein TYRP_020971 [Tyrophagus putrescentiae]
MNKSLFLVLFFAAAVYEISFAFKNDSEKARESAGECKGGQGIYQTLVNETAGRNPSNKQLVYECFETVRKIPKIKWGCYHAFSDRCRCTIDSNFIWSYDQTLAEGLYSLLLNSDGFEWDQAETHQGNFYLAYSCAKGKRKEG